VAKTWRLDTGTKGTGAHVVPLEGPAQGREPARDELSVVPLRRPPKPRPEPAPRAPRRFKIIDVVTRETLAEHVDTRTALRVLRDVRHNVDIQVYVSDPSAGAWRLLSLTEQRALWDARHRVADHPPRL
jgi:hypothetical protein